LLVVVQEEAQEEEEVDKCVLYVTMVLEMEVQVQVEAGRAVAGLPPTLQWRSKPNRSPADRSTDCLARCWEVPIRQTRRRLLVRKQV
jgi:hypothetical protein